MAVSSVSGQPPTELETSAAEPGLFSVNSSCLSALCLLGSHFDPLPSATGGACISASGGAPAWEGGFFQTVQCAGAFPSPHYADNWLAGWSLLFPVPLGTDIASAAEVGVGLGALAVSSWLHTAFLRQANSPPVLGREWLTLLNFGTTFSSPRCLQQMVTFDESQCPLSAFSAEGPVFWARLTPPAGMLHLSTCTRGGAGFDTDLSVFELGGAGGCELKQVACNGDGFGDQGCQPLYSRLSLASHGNTTYVVAVGGHGGQVGDNVTLTARVTQPETPPPTPPPATPPPSPLHSADLQTLIDRAPRNRPFVMLLGPVLQLQGSLVIPSGKQVVLRGEAPHNRTVVFAESGRRHFEVRDGGELYLSNLEVTGGLASGACGGAVIVHGRGKLVAQYCIFANNLAARGGAVCVKSDGELMMVAVEMVDNYAFDGENGIDINLGRPTITEPRVELLGVRFSEDNENVLTRIGVWTTSSCLSAPGCLFHHVGRGFDTLAARADCYPLRTSRASHLNIGSQCACTTQATVPFAQTDEQQALAPYGLSPVDSIIEPSVNLPACRLPRTLVRASSFSDVVTTIELSKTTSAQGAQQTIVSIAMDFLKGVSGAIQESGASWHVVALRPGVHTLRTCLDDQQGHADDDDDFSCTIFENGSMSVSFMDFKGWPIRVLQTSGTIEANRGYISNVEIPILADTRNVRETERFPYQQKLTVIAEVEHKDGVYRFSKDVTVRPGAV